MSLALVEGWRISSIGWSFGMKMQMVQVFRLYHPKEWSNRLRDVLAMKIEVICNCLFAFTRLMFLFSKAIFGMVQALISRYTFSVPWFRILNFGFKFMKLVWCQWYSLACSNLLVHTFFGLMGPLPILLLDQLVLPFLFPFSPFLPVLTALLNFSTTESEQG